MNEAQLASAAAYMWYEVWGYNRDIPVSEDTTEAAKQWAEAFDRARQS